VSALFLEALFMLCDFSPRVWLVFITLSFAVAKCHELLCGVQFHY